MMKPPPISPYPRYPRDKYESCHDDGRQFSRFADLRECGDSLRHEPVPLENFRSPQASAVQGKPTAGESSSELSRMIPNDARSYTRNLTPGGLMRQLMAYFRNSSLISPWTKI